MSDSKPHTGIKGSAVIWVATLIVALAIIGVAVYVATSEQQPAPPTARQAQIAQQPVTRPQPETVPEPEASRPSAAPVRERPTASPSRQKVRPAPERARVPQPEAQDETGPATLQLDNLAGTLTLSLPFMEVRNKIPLDNTCYRANQSPAMDWASAPQGTQSYVVFMERRTGNDDADRPFVNWLLFNIPADAHGLAANLSRSAELPDGARHAKSDHNILGYVGPCEPKGQYTYAIRVFALDRMLDLAAGASKDALIRAMNGHIIDAAAQEFIHYKML